MSSLRSAFAGKHLLVTGVTGFVGKVFVAFLLDHELPARITILSRGKRGKDARSRLADLFARSPAFRPLRARHGEALGAWLEERIDVVEGDARSPGLGIGEGQRAALASRIDAVVNVAGITDFSPDPLDAIAVNVQGALAAAELARLTPGKRLLHVSTCFVAGGVDGPVPEQLALERDGDARSPNGTRFDPEDELRAIESMSRSLGHAYADIGDARRARIEAGTLRARALGWPNLYTYSKALAELLIASRQRRERHPVRVSIVRPSIVECARTFPLVGWNEGVNTAAPLVWLTGTMHRHMPFDGDNVFDVIPVDDVVKGMVLALGSLLGDESPPLDVVQVATGDHNPFTLRRALDLTALARRRQYARSSDPFERIVLQHLDSVIWDMAPDADPVLPALKTGVRAARDLLVGFSPEHYLPRRWEGWGAKLRTFTQKAGKELGQASRTVGQVSEMLRAYQPFVFDHDPHFCTERMRSMSAALSDEERASFGVRTESMDWRQYWMDVEIPGLDRWSLPVLRGERVEGDEPQPLKVPLKMVEPLGGDREEPALHLGDAE